MASARRWSAPAVAEPIVDQCVEAIATAVANVTTANAYTTNISTVHRFLKDPQSESVDTYACVVVRRDTPQRQLLGPRYTSHQARVEVYVFTNLPSEDTNPDQYLSRAGSDVRKAIHAAITPGESAIFDRIDWAGTEYETAMDEHRVIGGVRVDFDAQFVTDTTDPTVGRS